MSMTQPPPSLPPPSMPPPSLPPPSLLGSSPSNYFTSIFVDHAGLAKPEEVMMFNKPPPLIFSAPPPEIVSDLSSESSDPTRNPRYKTEICRNFKERNRCIYGDQVPFEIFNCCKQFLTRLYHPPFLTSIHPSSALVFFALIAVSIPLVFLHTIHPSK